MEAAAPDSRISEGHGAVRELVALRGVLDQVPLVIQRQRHRRIATIVDRVRMVRALKDLRGAVLSRDVAARAEVDVHRHAAVRPGLAGLGGGLGALECPATWEKQVLSARGFKRVGRHSEYAI